MIKRWLQLLAGLLDIGIDLWESLAAAMGIQTRIPNSLERLKNSLEPKKKSLKLFDELACLLRAPMCRRDMSQPIISCLVKTVAPDSSRSSSLFLCPAVPAWTCTHILYDLTLI